MTCGKADIWIIGKQLHHSVIGWVRLIIHALTHWGRVTYICVSKLTIIGSENGFSPGRRQAIIWTNDGILLIGPLETYFSKILIEIQSFFIQENAFENVVWKMAAILSWPQCVEYMCKQFFILQILDMSRIKHDFEYDTKGRKWKLCLDYELEKDTHTSLEKRCQEISTVHCISMFQ